MRKLKFSVIILINIFLSSCNGSAELESRAFAAAIGVDATEGAKISVSVSIPSFGSDKGSPEWSVKSADGYSVRDCLSQIDAQISGKLFLGHVKTVTLGKKLIEDERLFKAAVKDIAADDAFGRGIVVLSAENAEETLKNETEKEKNGFFSAEYIKNNGLDAPKIRDVLRSTQ